MSVAVTDSTTPVDDDVPRSIDRGLPASDRAFFAGARVVGALVLVLTGSIGLFLFLQLVPTVHAYGFSFFTQAAWYPTYRQVGVLSAVVGTFEVAAVAVVISVPLALLTALYITEYAPRWLRGPLVSLVDLMAAIPSIIYGLWGFFLLMPRAEELARWLSAYMSWIPIFKYPGTDPHAAVTLTSVFGSSAAIAGVVVSMMVTPIACALMRGVFDQAPIGEREGALALGATRWGVIRSVVLPFGRSGIIGGTMLGLGRALGETIAVSLILSQSFTITIHILQRGSNTISYLIADEYSNATVGQLRALLAAGFVLFGITLIVNMIAAVFITRSRSGAATEI
ncbi:MAG TPA: phosphate ABC transporter permease subunit PstC [Streptosporangiaceae bacterium]|nr:phosphate ABC transporter permease subunit PstC [Streptosporangiaceae bacterium]